MPDQKPTRLAAEMLMQQFIPNMGLSYAKQRNFDHGPDGHRHVSTLSPFIRRRLVLEQDIVAAALAHHGPEASEKFVQEVIWRGYFKGWLEHRPEIWTSYRQGLERDFAAMNKDRQLRARVARAEEGATGVACFDAWVRELKDTGYLHNHARMWFASIWIFTLGLPWRMGADLFLRYLLDGDAASNTLGWRWVAGLHTRGKAYKAQAWNIAKFTKGRFNPQDGDLAEDIQSLEGEEPDGLPPVSALRALVPPVAGQPTALVITEEDCRIEDFDLNALDIRAVATLSGSHLRSPLDVSAHVLRFEQGALADTAARLAMPATHMQAGQPSDLARWARSVGARQIVTPYIPEGPLRDWLRQAEPALSAQEITFCEWRRDWDSAIWPHATAGFFKVKARIPAILEQMGLRYVTGA